MSEQNSTEYLVLCGKAILDELGLDPDADEGSSPADVRREVRAMIDAMQALPETFDNVPIVPDKELFLLVRCLAVKAGDLVTVYDAYGEEFDVPRLACCSTRVALDGVSVPEKA